MYPRCSAQIPLATLLITLAAGGCVGTDETPAPREDPFAVRPFPADVHAVCYGPHRDGQHPDGPSPSADELREDLRLMLPHWNLLRVYGSSGFAETLLEIIRADGLDMKVVLGAWIGPDDAAGNRHEVNAAIRLTAVYPGIVVAVCVGNETQVSWSAHRCGIDTLIDSVRRVRAGVAVPVTSADDFNFWNKPVSRTLAAEIDFVMMHAHPMWNGRQLDEALEWLRDQTTEVQVLHPDRAVVIGETGWATSVHDQGEQAELIKGIPGEKEQARFYREVLAWAADEGLTTFVFEAFDENWKGGDHPAEVEKHWGLFRADRSAKAALE
ncbi:hypothetical protein H8E07_16070 [bacterium]|nr:hypothetical protein [bacterium]